MLAVPSVLQRHKQTSTVVLLHAERQLVLYCFWLLKSVCQISLRFCLNACVHADCMLAHLQNHGFKQHCLEGGTSLLLYAPGRIV